MADKFDLGYMKFRSVRNGGVSLTFPCDCTVVAYPRCGGLGFSSGSRSGANLIPRSTVSQPLVSRSEANLIPRSAVSQSPGSSSEANLIPRSPVSQSLGSGSVYVPPHLRLPKVSDGLPLQTSIPERLLQNKKTSIPVQCLLQNKKVMVSDQSPVQASISSPFPPTAVQVVNTVAPTYPDLDLFFSTAGFDLVGDEEGHVEIVDPAPDFPGLIDFNVHYLPLHNRVMVSELDPFQASIPFAPAYPELDVFSSMPDKPTAVSDFVGDVDKLNLFTVEKHDLTDFNSDNVHYLPLHKSKSIDSGKTRVDSGKTRVDSGKTRVDSEKTRVDSEKTRVDSGKTRAASGKTRAASGKTCVDSGKTRVDSSKTRVDSSKTRVDSSKTRVDSSKTRVDSSKTRVDSSKTRVDSGKTGVWVVKRSGNTLVGSGNTLVGSGNTGDGSGNTGDGSGNTGDGSGNTRVGSGKTRIDSGKTHVD